MREMDSGTLIKLLNEIAEEAGTDAPRSYSGRSMYGKNGVGVYVDRYDGMSLTKLVWHLAVKAAALEIEWDDRLEVTTDTLGKGTVAYWIWFEWVGEPSDKEE